MILAATTRLAALAYRAFRPVVFALDPETAHDWTFAALRLVERALAHSGVQPQPLRVPELEQTVAGMHFPNPVGLAAGLDKAAEVPHVWALLGFGFAELGTVTAKPQEGNPKPRLWRCSELQALVNRMGFNNPGAEQVARTLTATLTKVPSVIPLGINIGKSRSTPLDAAAEDYAATFARLAPTVDYVCVNVSSPNTPGLRELQSASQLATLLERLQAENQRLVRAGRIPAPRPLFVKVAPDLSVAQVGELAQVARAHRVAAIVATNTTLDHRDLRLPAGATGGVSGAPLRARATAIVREFFRCLKGDIPIVGVGGIFTAEDAYEKILAGASLVQVYTGLIYRGPAIAREICHDLVERLARDGARHVREVIGRNAEG